MADFRKLFGTDTRKEEEGVWHDLGGVKVKVARMNNPAHQTAVERITKPYRGQIARGTLPKEKLDELAIRAMAEALLLGWEGLELDGQPIAYSVEAAAKLLTDFRDFRETISALSLDANVYREEEITEAEKNSSAG
ncbi:MAG: hypothetical protein FJY95_22500 [Candidatus Handelsmanbacteria bacterium]|nr:hypothetical protein [Candidatus Handelsmanbacteria bacterium]